MRIFILIISLLSCTGLAAQEQEAADSTASAGRDKPTFSFFDRFFTGGNLGLSFGSATYVEVAPVFGYRLTERMGVGIGGTYIYLSDRDYNYESSIYGGRLFTRYMILEEIFAHAEYEQLIFKNPYISNGYFAESLFVGAGYRNDLGGIIYPTITILYNVIHNEKSPYPIPIVIRGGIGIGF